MLVTLDTIFDGVEYDIVPKYKDGQLIKPTRYEVAPGTEVTLKLNTIELVEELEKVGSPENVMRVHMELAPLMVNEEFPDKGVFGAMCTRVVGDFFLMCVGTEKRQKSF